MVETINRRVAGKIEGPFVLFLIGVRLNRLWTVARWAGVLAAMPRMLAELQAEPSLGLLHARAHFGLRSAMMVQYWRSHEHLQAYAEGPDRKHRPAWSAFNRRIGTSGDVGIWHETYLIEPGHAESVYVNMPPFGLGRAGTLHDAIGPRATARRRLVRAPG